MHHGTIGTMKRSTRHAIVRYCGLLLIPLFLITFFGIKSYKNSITAVQTQVATSSLPTATIVSDYEVKTHLLGSADAPYTLIYYIDYDCPYCVEHSFSDIQKIPKQRPNVRVVVRHLPLTDLHPTAYKKAALVECLVGRGDNFFRLSELIIAHKDESASSLTPQDLALKDPSLFKQCLDEPVSLASVLKSLKGASSIGLYSTPSILLLDSAGKTLTKVNFISEQKTEVLFNYFVKE